MEGFSSKLANRFDSSASVMAATDWDLVGQINPIINHAVVLMPKPSDRTDLESGISA